MLVEMMSVSKTCSNREVAKEKPVCMGGKILKLEIRKMQTKYQ